MASTQVQVISNAISLLGQAPIQTLQNPNAMVTAAIQAWNLLLPAKLSEGPWRFAVTIQQLSKLVQVPVVQQWQYIYALPQNFLKMIHLYPQNYDFEIYEGGQLYTNLIGPLFIEYVFQPVQELIPDYFNLYFAYEIAAYLALTNSQNTAFYSALEAKREYQRAIAMAADAQNRPQTPLFSHPMISRRFVSPNSYG